MISEPCASYKMPCTKLIFIQAIVPAPLWTSDNYDQLETCHWDGNLTPPDLLLHNYNVEVLIHKQDSAGIV